MSRHSRRKFSDFQKTNTVLSHVQHEVPASLVCEGPWDTSKSISMNGRNRLFQFSSRFLQRLYSAGTQPST